MTKDEQKAAIQAEALGLIDGVIGNQRGKNAALAGAMVALFDHIIDKKDCINDLRFARSQFVYYTQVMDEMHICCAEIEMGNKNVKPAWPEPPQRNTSEQ